MTRRPDHRRPATFVPMLAVSITAVFGFVALAVDLGLVTVARTECQNAADSAALTGCRLLNNKTGVTDNNRANAEAAARDVIATNWLFGDNFTADQAATVAARAYNYDGTKFVVSPTRTGTQSWSAMEVQLAVEQPTFFAKVMGVSSLSNGARAVAVHRPRDIAIILDFSGSMGYGSTLGWPYDSDNIHALLNPDSDHPQFGPWGRYEVYQTGTTSTSNTTNGNPSNRPNPFRTTAFNGAYAPNNLTVEANGGPAMANDFLTVPGDPASVSGTSNYQAAFPTRRPSGFATQGVSTYDGDLWPRADGGRGPRTSGLGTGTPEVTLNNYSGWSQNRTGTTYGSTSQYRDWRWREDRRDFDQRSSTTTTNSWSSLESISTQRQREFTMTWEATRNPPRGDRPPDSLLPAATATSNQGNPTSSYNLTDALAKHPSQLLASVLTTLNDGILDRDTVRDHRVMSGFSFPTATGYQHPTTSTVDGGSTDANYRDAIWEAYGYDLDIEDYRSDGATKSVRLVDAARRFKGYSTGPGHWGKSFFMWPPDPRWGGGSGTPNPAGPATSGTFAGVKDTSGNWICDWRRRFFLRGDGQPFDPQTDNINRVLFRTGGNGHTLADVVTTVTSPNTVNNQPGYFRINYPAVMAWLKSSPSVLPTNLRAGRILYYSATPDDLTAIQTYAATSAGLTAFRTATGNPSATAADRDAHNAAAARPNLDRLWWRHYVHYILGVAQFDATNAPLSNWDYPPNAMLAGTEQWNPVPTSAERDAANTDTAQFDPNGTSAPPAQPRPYMQYSHCPNMPRAHFWFGPLTMINFMERRGEGRPWWAGTVREAQCWQLKASVNSALDDMRANNPNGFVGICGFATRTHFNTPLAPMSQDWYTLRNVLFFRKDTVADMRANLQPNGVTSSSTLEHRPYNSTFGSDTAQIPNGSGSTDPSSGFAVAYNLLSSSTTLAAADYGTRGRIGAAKVVIFETDGQPNNTSMPFSVTGSAENTRYQASGTLLTATLNGVTVSNLSGTNQNSAHAAIRIAQQIVAPRTGVGTWGHSTPNTPARIYSIMFGDLFEGYDGTNFSSLSGNAKGALEFGLRIQQVGGTSEAGNPPTVKIPDEQVITGSYTNRINNMRNAFERIMQSGVQVTLIE